MLFANRQEAGRQLAEKLKAYQGKKAVAYALPRGGVVLGFEVARRLGIPLDVVIARKIGHPYSPEYAVCAVAEDGEMVCNEKERAGLDPIWLEKAAAQEQQEIQRRRKTYLGERMRIPARGKTVLIIDDGAATGLTIIAAIRAMRRENPASVVAAVPVAPNEVVLKLRSVADEAVVLRDEQSFLGAVGAYYKDFPQVSDKEVIALLRNYPD